MTRADRLWTDVRQRWIWDLGGILYDTSRDLRIRHAQNWRSLMAPSRARYPMPFYGWWN